MRVFVDSSAIVALLFARDDNHQVAVDCLRLLTMERAELILSNFVVAETYNLLAARTYPARAREWLLANTWPVERITVADEEEATPAPGLPANGRRGGSVLPFAIPLSSAVFRADRRPISPWP
ncbi:MAG: PIN domain-containing protein [Clostridia bacterium]|nr:MAG: PIN domain-containing protein [Clostridia bacterium]